MSPRGRPRCVLGKKSKKLNDFILKNAQNDYPKSWEDIAREFSAKENVTISREAVREREYRVTKAYSLPLRGYVPKGWKPTKDGPQSYKDINDFIKINISLPRNELAEKCGVSTNAVYLREVALGIKRAKKKNGKKSPEPEELSREEVLENLALPIRKRNDPPILEISREEWKKPTLRVGFVSGISYLNEGFRRGAVQAGFERLRDECARYNILLGLLLDKHGFMKKRKKLLEQKKTALEEQKRDARNASRKIPRISVRELRNEVENELIEDTASALSSLIPKIQKPNGKFVRLYIQTSPTYDGQFGERVAHRLSEIRPNDIVVYKKGSDRYEVKGRGRYIRGVVPVRNRIPSQYYSTAVEKEIKDERGRISHIPDMWVVGPFASDIYTPDGVHQEPYISLPGLRNLEEVRTAENQIGITILDYQSNELLPYKRSWSLREQIENERRFVSPPRGATDLQKKIIGVIQRRGSVPIGIIDDRLPEHSREEIGKALETLVEDMPSKLKTWPGLYYDKASRRYDFHLEWIQERLRYHWPTALEEDRMLFVGCMHFGYTTSDYQHMIQEYPRIILENKITHWFGLGDFVAGMKHDLPHSGELIAGMNYTDHERFAAEGVATIIFRVFAERFKQEMNALKKEKCVDASTLARILEKSILHFPFISGNHDMWVLRDGHTPLSIFYNCLTELLISDISSVLSKHCLPFVDVAKVIREHIAHFVDVEAEYVLPSGLRVGMLHPYEGGSKTTTLKLQELLAREDKCQIWAIANYHRATVMREWHGRLGERVGIMAGAGGPVYTFFERRHRKPFNDFGPIYLRVLSHDKRIAMHEVGYFNRPLLKERISKYTNPDDLKRELGLLTL